MVAIKTYQFRSHTQVCSLTSVGSLQNFIIRGLRSSLQAQRGSVNVRLCAEEKLPKQDQGGSQGEG